MSILRLLSLSLVCCAGLLTPAAFGHSDPVTLLEFNPSAGQLPESLTLDQHGNLYVALAGSATIAIASFAINRAIAGQEAKPALLGLRTRAPGLPLSKPGK